MQHICGIHKTYLGMIWISLLVSGLQIQGKKIKKNFFIILFFPNGCGEREEGKGVMSVWLVRVRKFVNFFVGS